MAHKLNKAEMDIVIRECKTWPIFHRVGKKDGELLWTLKIKKGSRGKIMQRIAIKSEPVSYALHYIREMGPTGIIKAKQDYLNDYDESINKQAEYSKEKELREKAAGTKIPPASP